MCGTALAVTTPAYPWYALLLVALVALDGQAEWLAFAAGSGRAGYGAAVVIVAAVWLARRAKRRAAAAAGHPGDRKPLYPERLSLPAIREPQRDPGMT
jgi:hypothetical protein